MNVTTPTIPTAASAADLDRIVDEHLAAELRADLPAVLATMSADVCHDVIGAPAPSIGRAAVAEFYEELWAGLHFEAMRPVRRLRGADFIVDEVLAVASAVGNPFGMAGNGRRIQFRLVHVFEITDGVITRETAALDLPAIMAQLS
jgi:steroid delta-isomerase-like uncharacterized protein